MFSISNTRIPIKSVEADLQGNGSWEMLPRGDPDNHFAINGQHSFPIKVCMLHSFTMACDQAVMLYYMRDWTSGMMSPS